MREHGRRTDRPLFCGTILLDLCEQIAFGCDQQPVQNEWHPQPALQVGHA